MVSKDADFEKHLGLCDAILGYLSDLETRISFNAKTVKKQDIKMLGFAGSDENSVVLTACFQPSFDQNEVK